MTGGGLQHPSEQHSEERDTGACSPTASAISKAASCVVGPKSWLARAAGLEMTNVPYEGGPPIVQDLLAGQLASALEGVECGLFVPVGTPR